MCDHLQTATNKATYSAVYSIKENKGPHSKSKITSATCHDKEKMKLRQTFNFQIRLLDPKSIVASHGAL